MKIKDHAYLRGAGAVKRMHTIRMQGQTNAEHSWGVAMLVLACSDAMPSAALLAAALTHDLPEFRTGDTPATAKWDHPELEHILRKIEDKWFEDFGVHYKFVLTNEERVLLKFCDRAELAWRCVEEIKSGNVYALEVFNNIMGMLRGTAPNVLCEMMRGEIHAQLVEQYQPTKFYQGIKYEAAGNNEEGDEVIFNRTLGDKHGSE